jgi:putative DNA methylase
VRGPPERDAEAGLVALRSLKRAWRVEGSADEVTYKRKLIEVALPLEAINREAAREKSIRHGHPSTLHLWWARRPLAVCRAVLFASLVDDPSAHPDQFPTDEQQASERQRLFRIIEDLVKWENSTNEMVLSAARAEILRSCDGKPPPVVDPFCGGGSIPLEAQRLGLEARASDLNPVAVLITKALIEIPPKFADQPPVNPDSRTNGLKTWKGAQGLADDVRYYGKWMRQEAERRIGHLYPKVKLPKEYGGGKATVIAWIWARTVKSPDPSWPAPTPLVRSFSLSTKPGREAWVEPIVDRAERRIRFEIRQGKGAPPGTVTRTGAVCLATGTAVPLEYVRAEGKGRRIAAQLMAIVAEGRNGRIYLPPDKEHEHIATSVVAPDDVATADLPEQALGFRVQAYGMTRFSDLFTSRQLVALATFSDLVDQARERALVDGAEPAYAEAIAVYLALAASRLADIQNALCGWGSTTTQVLHLFTRQTVSMLWDYAENNAFGGAAGDYGVSLATVVRVLQRLNSTVPATSVQRDAKQLSVDQPSIVATDPPYYDNVGYADLSDFFYVWLRRSLQHISPKDFQTLLVPKAEELVANPYRSGGSKQRAEQGFERGLEVAFQRMRECQHPDFPLTVVYGFKQSEDETGGGHFASTGWDTMLAGLLRTQFSIEGTWPMRSERANRMRSQGSNALASSIILVCRPRKPNAPLTTRRDFVVELKRLLPGALRNMQQGNIAPVDLAQASIGPGMGIFSAYSKVLEADGSAMTVRAALGLINQILDESLSELEADFDPNTRWAIAWFEQCAMNPGPFGLAETLSKAKNTGLNALVHTGIVESKGGKVRLLDRAELDSGWNPTQGHRVTVWEVTQRLIGALDSGGEQSAAVILRQVGGLADPARELAYRLYNVCERKKWPQEALAYNALVVAWPEIKRLAAEAPSGQQSLEIEEWR